MRIDCVFYEGFYVIVSGRFRAFLVFSKYIIRSSPNRILLNIDCFWSFQSSYVTFIFLSSLTTFSLSVVKTSDRLDLHNDRVDLYDSIKTFSLH